MTNKQISDRERIAQVAHDTRVNERIACFFEQISHSLFCSQKMSDSPNFLKIKSYLYVHFLKVFFYRASHSLFFGEQCERIAQVTLDKRAI